jgi:hypothetical protein
LIIITLNPFCLFSIASAQLLNRRHQETFKFIGRGSSEANLKPEQLVVLQQFKRAEEVGCAGLGSSWREMVGV